MMEEDATTEERELLLYLPRIPGYSSPRHPRPATSALVISGLRTTMLPWKTPNPELSFDQSEVGLGLRCVEISELQIDLESPGSFQSL